MYRRSWFSSEFKANGGLTARMARLPSGPAMPETRARAQPAWLRPDAPGGWNFEG